MATDINNDFLVVAVNEEWYSNDQFGDYDVLITVFKCLVFDCVRSGLLVLISLVLRSP